MKEEDMEKIAGWIIRVLKEVKDYRLLEDKKERVLQIKKFKKDIAENQSLKDIQKEIKEFCGKFPLPY